MAFPDGTADFRSDTVTRPTEEMRAAMASADVGDDVYSEDPTVNLLQEEAAALTGKEAALYVPSGTMGNQLALGLQSRPGEEVVCVETAHIRNFEAGAPGALWGIQYRTVPSATGAMTPSQLREVAQASDYFQPRIALLTWENSHNASGGTVVDVGSMIAATAVARERGWRVHLDGARIFNASVATNESVEEFAALADTVSFCFSKGLGAPVGSILCGDLDLIGEARFLRRRLGGGMRQAGVLAAAARVALSEWKRLEEDHQLARRLAARIHDLYPEAVNLSQIQTNMVLVFESGLPTAIRDLIAAAAARGVMLSSSAPGRLRLVTHRDVDERDVDRLIEVMTEIGGMATSHPTG